MTRFARLLSITAVLLATAGRPAAALDTLCDPSFQNCRTTLIALINNERVGIDAAFWFMEDTRYANAIIARWKAGVPVRLLVDPRTVAPYAPAILKQFADAGVPMRYRVASGIMHWKMMLFAGQGVVEFGSANYSPYGLVPVDPYKNYQDETVYFTDDPALVGSFMTKFDSSWVDGTNFRHYANITSTPTRRYPKYPISPELNFTPGQSFALRSVDLYNKEAVAINAIMFRVTDPDHVDALIAARRRGVVIRVIHEPTEYRNAAKLWDPWAIDRMWKAGIVIRMRAHAGQTHQKSVILRSLRTVIFGSSNWTGPSDNTQQEHNYFMASKPELFVWFVNQFARKWLNANPIGAIETKAFTPLPPDVPRYRTPAHTAANLSRSQTLKWYGGPWAHTYDVYFGTSSTPPLYAANRALGPSQTSSQNQSFTLPTLAPRTTYYWKIVSKTMAGKTASGPTWSFSTGS